MRIPPAESRVRKLAKEIPASIVLFDLLADGDKDLRTDPFSKRRAAPRRGLKPPPQARLRPQTTAPEEAVSWFDRDEGAGCDGVVSKRADQVYAPAGWPVFKVM